MRDIFDTNGQPLDNAPHNDLSDDTRGTLSAADAAEWQERNDKANAIRNRFADIAPPSLIQDAGVALMYTNMARQFTTHGKHNEAKIYFAIARSISESVEKRRAALYAQIESEMNTDE